MAKTAKAKTKTTSAKKVTKTSAAPAKRTTIKRTKAANAKRRQQFLEFRVTEQTLYWLLFGAAAIIFTMWLYALDARVRDLYDQIDTNMRTADAAFELQMHKTNEKRQAE